MIISLKTQILSNSKATSEEMIVSSPKDDSLKLLDRDTTS